jgi:hypothetical protein
MNKASKPNANICFFTRRLNPVASINLANLIEISRHQDINILIAYGGETESSDFSYLKEKINFFNKGNNRIHLFCEECPNDRMEWLFSYESDWIIFVSDDDPFTTNHITTLLEEIKTSEDHVTHIAPQAYFLLNQHQTRIHEVKPIAAENPFERATILLNEKFQGLRFYSALRTQHAKKIQLELIKNRFVPTYSDQLIIFYSALKGNFSVARNFSALLYDMSNWSTDQATITSDLKGYSQKTSLLFHEVYWIRDYFRCMKGLNPPSEFFAFFKEYCIKMLAKATHLFEKRYTLIKISDNSARAKYELALHKLTSNISAISNWEELGITLNFNSDGDLKIDEYIAY